jgi:polysaccharide deacetylase 2 family uncharacterized protein YibQ
MSDLHKPLGQKKEKADLSKWRLPVLGALGLAALSLAAYVFIDARTDEKEVVALGSETEIKTIVKTEQFDDLEPPSDNIDTPGSAFKPLSPLEPLDSDTPPNRTAVVKENPAFKPLAVPRSNRSPGVVINDLVEKSEFGPLPRASQGGMRPLDAYSQSSGNIGANRVAIIVGGLGLSQTGTQSAIRELPSEITLGFSPFGNSLQRWMQTARREGHEVTLQLPMEPLGYPTIDPGPQTLTSKASVGENLGNLRWSLGRMTNYPMVTNYLGAGLTNKDTKLRPILQEIKNRGLAFFDDGSVDSSMAIPIAKDIRLSYLQGNAIIDSRRDANAMRSQLNALEGLAKQQGFAVGTATAFPDTIAVIKEWAENAQKRGILIVPASNLVKDFKR